MRKEQKVACPFYSIQYILYFVKKGDDGQLKIEAEKKMSRDNSDFRGTVYFFSGFWFWFW